MKTVRAALALLIVCAPFLATGAWTPPPQPDPRVIHNEARKDRMEGRFDDALARHLWLHREGAKADPRWEGVRLSFALGDWAHLAQKHAPAMEAFKAAREAAEADVRAGREAASAFADFAAINRELDEPGRTVALFAWVEARDAALARDVYRFAEHALVESGDYKTAMKYMDANASMARAVRVHMAMIRNMPKNSDEDAPKRAREVMAREAGRIIAVLVHNGRRAHAKVIAEQAIGVSDAPEVRKVIEAALEGTVPKEALSRGDKATLRQMMP